LCIYNKRRQIYKESEKHQKKKKKKKKARVKPCPYEGNAVPVSYKKTIENTEIIKWAIQRNWQHWVHKTTNTKSKRTQCKTYIQH
jgi:hypothetical protein